MAAGRPAARRAGCRRMTGASPLGARGAAGRAAGQGRGIPRRDRRADGHHAVALGARLRPRRRCRRCRVACRWRRWVWCSTRTRRGCRSAPVQAAPAASIRPPTYVRTPRRRSTDPADGHRHFVGCERACGSQPAGEVLVSNRRRIPAAYRAPRRVSGCSTTSATRAEIYRQSFATIRAEADLSRFPDDVARVVVRLIHTCGQVDVAEHVAFSDDVVAKTHAALAAGAPVLCDSSMVAAGHHEVPAACRQRGGVAGRRHQSGRSGRPHRHDTIGRREWTLWADRLGGAVLAIGNAPTALVPAAGAHRRRRPDSGRGAGRPGPVSSARRSRSRS